MNKTLIIVAVLAIAYFVFIKKPTVKTTGTTQTLPTGIVTPTVALTVQPVDTLYTPPAPGVGVIAPTDTLQSATSSLSVLGQTAPHPMDPMFTTAIPKAAIQTNAPQSAVALKSTLVLQPVSSPPFRAINQLQAVPYTTA